MKQGNRVPSTYNKPQLLFLMREPNETLDRSVSGCAGSAPARGSRRNPRSSDDRGAVADGLGEGAGRGASIVQAALRSVPLRTMKGL